MNKVIDNNDYKWIDTTLNVMCRMICKLLDMTDSFPTIVYGINDEKHKDTLGFYYFEKDLLCLNESLIKSAIQDSIELYEKNGNCLGYFPKTENWIKLISTLVHEIKHRDQHFHSTTQFQDDFKIESTLDLSKEDDFKKYANLSIEVDAQAFSFIGVAYLIDDFSKIFLGQYSNFVLPLEVYIARMGKLYLKYKDKIIQEKGVSFEEKLIAKGNELMNKLI